MARYEKGRKGETRRQIIEIASKRFRADGIDGVGIASLMAEAGLTNGGFYAHFASKEDLVREAVVHALVEMPGEPARTLAEDAHDLPAFVRRYLSTAHRDNPAGGCAVAALSPDLMRRPAASRVAFQTEGMATIERIASGLPGTIASNERLPRAFAIFSHLLGTLQMSRFVLDAAMSEAILARGHDEALRLADFEDPVHGETKGGATRSGRS